VFGLDDDKLSVRRLSAGETLFRQGDRTTHIFFLLEGRLRLERQTSEGRHVVLHTAQAGEFFAEASLFSAHYHCNAVALGSVSVRLYAKKDVLSAIASDPANAHDLLAYMALQLQRARLRAEIRAVKAARERVLIYLESVADKARRVPVSGAVQDIAAEIGLTREALYRTLAKLERAKIIERGKDWIKLL
jgi:CRP-like cAMP-binding protein